MNNSELTKLILKSFTSKELYNLYIIKEIEEINKNNNINQNINIIKTPIIASGYHNDYKKILSQRN